jgi:hypothetical protein
MERFSQLDEFSPLRCGHPEFHGADVLAEAPTDPAIEIPDNAIEDPYEWAMDEAFREAIGWSLMILATVAAILTAAVMTWFLT